LLRTRYIDENMTTLTDLHVEAECLQLVLTAQSLG